MISSFIQWFEAKTQVYLYPRFVIAMIFLFLSITLFSIAYFFSRAYTESVQTVGPQSEKEKAEYDAFMRRGVTNPSLPDSAKE